MTEGRTGKRILVIFGTRQDYILRDLVQSVLDFESIEVGDYQSVDMISLREFASGDARISTYVIGPKYRFTEIHVFQ